MFEHLNQNLLLMKPNMGTTDRLIRISIAVVLAVLYFLNVLTGTLGIIALVVAAVFLLTSLLRFCPAYTLLGINTCKTGKAE
jgi:hypothetical protein